MKTVISIYSYGGIPGPVAISHVDLANHIAINKLPVVLNTIRDDALISRSRCRQTAAALLTDCDVWVQLDHDLEFDPVDVFRLAEIAMDKQAAVCVPYPCRSLPIRPAVRVKDPSTIMSKVGKDELVDITYCASGFMAVPLDKVRETIALCSSDAVPDEFKVVWCYDPIFKKYPSLWKPMTLQFTKEGEGLYDYLSEDYAASARMILAGIPQLAWTKPLLKHWGDYPYTLDGQYHG